MNKNISFAVNEEINASYPDHSRILFYRTEYLDLHQNLDFDHFYIVNETEKKVEGHILFEKDQQSRVSMTHGTFGSLELKGNPGYSMIYEFFSFIISYFKNSPVKTIIIRHFADFYDPVNGPVISAVLSHLGFNISIHDINHHLIIENNLFGELINKMEQRQLRKCMDAGLEFKQGSSGEGEKLYTVMADFRKMKNIPITFTLTDFRKSLEKLPEYYSLFYVQDKQGGIVAATLLVRITDHVLYYFFPADNPRRMAVSPMVLLMDGIYRIAKEHKFQFIDLGISSIHNHPQKGLIQFKENLGGIPSSRFTFQLDIQ